MNIPIVYEDEWFIIVDKPSGLLVVPTPKRERRTLTSILNEEGAKGSLWPCHRLDRETSGLIIYAKSKAAQGKMMDLFRAHKVRKTYLAAVQGVLKKQSGTIVKALEGLWSQTQYKLLCQLPQMALVKVNPLTGRTNQIRLHFKMIGHPLVGESVFAFRRDATVRAKRLCLHAAKLAFNHPFTGSSLEFTAQLPGDLHSFFLEKGVNPQCLTI